MYVHMYLGRDERGVAVRGVRVIRRGESERERLLHQHSFAPREPLGGWKYVSRYISHPVSMNVLSLIVEVHTVSV